MAPHILKVNTRDLNYDSWSAQSDMISAIGSLAYKIGANLLFEDIETVYQLQFAWKNGGRFYQGPYLANPAMTFVDKDILKERFKKNASNLLLRKENAGGAIFATEKIKGGIRGDCSPCETNKRQCLPFRVLS